MSAISYKRFDRSPNEKELEIIKDLISQDLSEPYSIYVYRYFLNQWADLCILAYSEDLPVGVIISKLESHRDVRQRGYIGMLAVKKPYRGRKIASNLVKQSLSIMIEQGADEIMLETEVVNSAAIALYENMGFLRTKRLYRYYLNRNDAYRLILPVTAVSTTRSQFLQHMNQENQEQNTSQ